MKEVGIDISTARSKGVDDVPLDRVLTVVTLCAEEECPALPGALHRLAWPLPDPAGATGGDDEILAAFRRTRDEIRELVSRLF
jgi:arsenate reductase